MSGDKEKALREAGIRVEFTTPPLERHYGMTRDAAKVESWWLINDEYDGPGDWPSDGPFDSRDEAVDHAVDLFLPDYPEAV